MDLAPPPPPLAAGVFGDSLPLAVRYADLLVGPGIERGLIGPRESQSIWERHLLNCAVVSEVLPPGARVLDVGSGAGLPGLAIACARADVTVDLIEPMQRRTGFLRDAVAELGLMEHVRVWQARAEEPSLAAAVGDAEWATARAVAKLDRLWAWVASLLRDGGRLLAMKGQRAEAEVAEARRSVERMSGQIAGIVEVGSQLAVPTRLVMVEKCRRRSRDR